MSEIARVIVIVISRQGVHKCVRNLENKGYVKLDYMINKIGRASCRERV